MTITRRLPFVLALGALLLAGCGAGDRTPTIAEVDEPSYREGEQLKNQGRNSEALAAFLRVIEKRGEQSSAESHLEAGLIYLNQIKDPLEAIHQFRKYLELQPNSRQAEFVRGQMDHAKRQYAVMLRGPNPLDSVQAEQQQEVERLQREVVELKAQLAMTPVSAPSSFLRTTPPPAEADPANSHVAPANVAPPVVRSTKPPASFLPPPPRPAAGAPNSRQVSPGPASVATPTRPAAATPAAGRTHVVQAGEGLFGIARKYYGTPTNAKINAIYEANREVMRSVEDLRPGMVLKIP